MNSLAEHESQPGPGRNCPRCGGALPANMPPELCPRCLLQAALPTQAGPSKTEKIPPTLPPAHAGGLPQPGEQLGHYRIVRLLGEGGMGAAFEAEDLENGRRVALKVLGQKLDSPNARERFFREGRIAASINHPNSVYVFGTEEIVGIPVIAMELVAGGTLQERVQRTGPLPVGEAIDSLLQIIKGLAAAQRLGILHRDVKPSNCFVDADGTVKIGDFGLSISAAVRTEPALTATEVFLGTPAFCSPEQLRGDELNVRSDMYSVGATLFYLLTGRTPFEGKTAPQLMAAALEQTAPSPAKFRPGIPRGLAAAVLRCLEKQPASRFRNYHELEVALTPYGSAAPTPATLGLRMMAGILDQCFAGALGLALLELLGKSPMDFLDPSGKVLPAMAGGTWVFAGLAVLYYATFEGIWGAALGKAIFGLRLVGPNRNPPGIGRALVRALIFVGGPALPAWLYFGFSFRAYAYVNQPAQYVVGASYYVILALLFSLARRRNGFASVPDLVTNTRVISKVAVAARPELPAPDLPLPSVEGKSTVGPYHILGTLEQAGQTQWLLGFDLRLLRRVWLRMVPADTPPVPLAWRNLGRVGRLRWLAGRRSAEEHWDAFEALSGQPLLALAGERQPWSRVRFWLYDLAQELSLAARDGTLPLELTLDRVWVTGDGRAKLLDFPAPGLTAGTHREAPPVAPRGFLAEIATVALAGRAGVSGGAGASVNVPLPLHVREFLARLPGFSDAEVVAAALKPLLQRVAAVTRWRRAAMVAGCLAIPLFVAASFVAGVALFAQWNRNHPGMLDLSMVLQQRAMMNSRWLKNQPHPSDRQFAIYIASHYRSVVTNEVIWNGFYTVGMIKGEGRQFAERSVAEHPAPTTDEIKDADAALKEPVERMHAYDFLKDPWVPWLSAVTALVLYVSLPAMLAALIFRGGLVLLATRVTFVRWDGARASRLRVGWRALVAWGTVIFGLLVSAVLKSYLGMAGAAAFFVLFTGALTVVSVVLPERGLPDRLAGTWPVPW